MNDETKRNFDEKHIAASALPSVFQRIAARFSLPQLFSFSFMAQFLLAAGLIAILLFRGGQEAVDILLKEMRQEVLERVHEQLSRHMKEPVRFNRLNADALDAQLFDLSDPVTRERYFVSHIRAFPDAAMAFIGLPDGSFYGARRKVTGEIQIVRNNKDTGGDSWYFTASPQGEAGERQEVFRRFDPRTRPWYKSGEQAADPVFTGIYRHFVFLEPTITAAQPVRDAEGKLIGVFGVDYLLSWLGDMLRGIPVGVSGQIFITDANGLLVAATSLKAPFEEQSGQFARIRAVEADNPVLRLAAQSLTGNTGDYSREISLYGRSYLVDVRGFHESGIDWKIYVVLARDDFFGGIQKAVDRTAVVTVLAIIMALFVAIWTSEWITRPIIRLNEAANELAEGRLQSVPDTERQDELGQLSRVFNKMACQLTDLVEGLEARVTERTKALAEKTSEEQQVRKMLHAELAKAGREQKAMLPTDIDDTQLHLQIIYEPYMLVSGDFCGYRWMKGESVLFGYIIDVNGHGVATALQTAAINVMIQETLQSNFSLSGRMAEINHRVARYFKDDLLVAACFFELDFAEKELRYVAAGITEFFANSIAYAGRIKTPGSFLGISDQTEFEIRTIPIHEGDCFCFYSDGIADQLMEGRQFPLGVTFGELVQSVNNIAAVGVRRDDVTAMCIRIGSLA